MRNISFIALVAAMTMGSDSYAAGSCVACPTGAICRGGAEAPERCKAGTWLNRNKVKLHTSGPNAGQPMVDPATGDYITEAVCDECPRGMFCPEGATAPMAGATPPGSVVMMTEVNMGFELLEYDKAYPDLSGWKYGINPMPDCPNKSTMKGSSITTKCPAGYLLADGSTLNIEDYPALFAVIGQTYGYEGGKMHQTFKLPDFRGHFLRMVGGGAEDLGNPQSSSNQHHTHSFSGTTGSSGAHHHGLLSALYNGSPYSSTVALDDSKAAGLVAHAGAQGASIATLNYIFDRGILGTDPVYMKDAGAHTHTFSGNTTAEGISGEARPVNYSVLYYIRY